MACTFGEQHPFLQQPIALGTGEARSGSGWRENGWAQQETVKGQMRKNNENEIQTRMMAVCGVQGLTGILSVAEGLVTPDTFTLSCTRCCQGQLLRGTAAQLFRNAGTPEARGV